MNPANNESNASANLGDYLRQKADSDLALVLLAIARGAIEISRELSFRVGMTESLNPFGEKQMELDVFANDLFSKLFIESGKVGSVASEELENAVTGGSVEERLSIGMDPLDGSSNIITNNPLGSIFGIWKGKLPQRGKDQIASAFVTYGPTLSLTFCLDGQVDQFIEARKGKQSGEFVQSYGKMMLPEKGEVYGFGGLRSEWIEPVSNFVAKLEERGLKLRYGGTFIGDYNQILQRGGIFSYPALKKKPKGKFRLNYEASPVALITYSAGGYSSDGEKSILEKEPSELSETTPYYTGNASLVREIERDISSSA